MARKKRPGAGEAHLPASEAGSELLDNQQSEGESDVGTPASEEDPAAAGRGELDDGRPGRGGPGAFPPPD